MPRLLEGKTLSPLLSRLMVALDPSLFGTYEAWLAGPEALPPGTEAWLAGCFSPGKAERTIDHIDVF